jgi:hypothetical protein
MMQLEDMRRRAFVEGYNNAMEQFYPNGPRLVAEVPRDPEKMAHESLLVTMGEAILWAKELGLDRLATDLALYMSAADVTLRSRG